MPDPFEARLEILPLAQKEIWPQLAPAPDLSLVLYGGTAVALHLGHRVSIDFDFFSSEPLEKAKIETSFQFARNARTIQEEKNTLVLSVPTVGAGQGFVLRRDGARPHQRSASNGGFGASDRFA